MPAVRLAALSIRVSGSKSDGVSPHHVLMNIKTAVKQDVIAPKPITDLVTKFPAAMGPISV